MKEFEKWLTKEIDDGKEMYPFSYDDCESAWKAALVWLKNNKEEIGNHYEHMVFNDIEEELEVK